MLRRLVEPQPAPNRPHDGGTKWVHDSNTGLHVPCGTVGHLSMREKMGLRCPLGEPGDTLRVRETWAPVDFMEVGYAREEPVCIGYAADRTALCHEHDNVHRLDTHAWNWDAVKWKSSATMPKWASRLMLEVLSTRVERLHTITEAEARAEGQAPMDDPFDEGQTLWQCHDPACLRTGGCAGVSSARVSFMTLWTSVHGAKSWEYNPWVWCVDVKVKHVAGRPTLNSQLAPRRQRKVSHG